ncbi:hypothetical protein ACHAWO_008069 [Cyclotella atomus]|uniref:Uncharacterized protein n=1 Tax=Cyclotella atomus TaxID=382360 RepID=A0ABD3MQZ1_9STRA
MADEPNHQQQQQISAMIEKKVNDLILHYATPKEEALQEDVDELTGSLTLYDAACCMVYWKWFSGHLARKARVDVPSCC